MTIRLSLMLKRWVNIEDLEIINSMKGPPVDDIRLQGDALDVESNWNRKKTIL